MENGFVRQKDVEVGNGNMNWKEILGAGAQSGVEWYVVERDFCGKPPVESVGESYGYLMGLIKSE